MESSDRKKILLLILLVAAALYFMYGSKTEPIHNEGMLTQDSSQDYCNDVIDVADTENSIPADLDSASSNTNTEEASIRTQESEEQLKRKMKPRKLSQSDDYKSSSYKNGQRKSKSSDIDRFFQGNHPQDDANTKGFTPVIENEGIYAAYMSDKNKKKMTDKDKFNPNALLPREKSEWFDDPHESVNVKSSKLLNIHRPVSVNTIQTTLKNPSHDIRGTPANPKYSVSPWGNSSYEPDTNLRNQSLCY